MSLLVFHTSRFRTRGTPPRSTRTCSLSWVWWGRKQRERWTNWEKTCGSLIALWTTRHREHFICFHCNFKVFSVKFHPQETYFPFIATTYLMNPGSFIHPPFFQLSIFKRKRTCFTSCVSPVRTFVYTEFVIYIDLSWNDPVKLPVFFCVFTKYYHKKKQVITLCVDIYILSVQPFCFC